MLLSDSLERGARETPDAAAVIFNDQVISYAELAETVDRVAAGLLSHGIRPGDHVAILLPNCPSFVFAYYAAVRIGAVAIPANPMLRPAELIYMWTDAEVKAVFTTETLLPNVLESQHTLPFLKHIVLAAPPAEAPSAPGILLMHDLILTGALALQASPNLLTEFLPADDSTCAVIIYTSGTTGRPKGAMLSHRNLASNATQFQDRLRMSPTDVFLTIIPLFHSFAGTVCMNCALQVGAAMLLMDSFSPGRTMDIIKRRRVSVFPAVPAIFHALLQYSQDKQVDVSSMRFFVSGGAPLPEASLAALLQRFQVPVLEGDGPTECSPVTCVNPLDGPQKAGSVGPALPGVTIAIFDDNDLPVPVETIGEIVVRGENVMMGYLNQPEATAEAMKSDWYHTGDLGKLDADGYLYIVDRKKDMIIMAGLNVYPREVEEVLYQHAAVAEAAVIGLPDALRGEEVAGVVVLKPDAHATERELMSFCRKLLAPYKSPRRIIFRDALPKGSTGKIVKRLLKKELELEYSRPTGADEK